MYIHIYTCISRALVTTANYTDYYMECGKKMWPGKSFWHIESFVAFHFVIGQLLIPLMKHSIRIITECIII